MDIRKPRRAKSNQFARLVKPPRYNTDRGYARRHQDRKAWYRRLGALLFVGNDALDGDADEDQ